MSVSMHVYQVYSLVTVHMLYCLTTVVYIQTAHIRKNETFLYHAITKYVPTTNMPLKYQIYSTYEN